MHDSLSRDSISRAATSILDDYGLADVTMRRVASALGVAPGALYWHVDNKQDLISAVAERILHPLVSTPAPQTPATLCSHLRSTLLEHRDGAEVVTTAMSQPGSAVPETLTRLMRDCIAIDLRNAGIEASTSDQHAAADGLLHMTLGATTVYQSARQLAETTGHPVADTDSTGHNGLDSAVAFLVDGLHARSAKADA